MIERVPQSPKVAAARRGSAPVLWGSVAVWGLMVTVGMVALWHYAFSPARPSSPPRAWPAGGAATRDAVRPTLMMFAHPHCPCTRSSIQQLARIMRFANGRLAARVVFFAPSGSPAGWERTDLWNSAAAIPGVSVGPDPDGALARQFGAVTSGAVLVYDTGGRLRFQGGITDARGHEGDSVGMGIILAILDGRSPMGESTPVFGCSLVDPRRAPRCCDATAEDGIR